MPRKVNSEHKIDRRRTRRDVDHPAIEQAENESKSSVPSENDGDDEDIHVPRDGRPARNVRCVTRNARSGNANLKRSGSENKDSSYGIEKKTNLSTTQTRGGDRRSARVRLRKKPATTQSRDAPTKSSTLSDSDDDEYKDRSDSTADNEDYSVDEKTREKNKSGGQKDAKLAARNTTPSTSTTSGRRSNRLSSARRRQSQCGKGGGDVLANLPSVPSTSNRHSAVKSRRKSINMAKEETKHDHGEDGDDGDDGDGDGRCPTRSGSGNEEDSSYDDEGEKEIDEMLQKRNNNKLLRNSNRSTTKKTKRIRVAHSSDEEFLLDSDDECDDSSRDHSLSDDTSAELTNDDNDILMIGDRDLSDDDSDHNDIMEKQKGNKRASTNVINIDDEHFGTIGDEGDSDDPCNDKKSQKSTLTTHDNEILPSPRGIKNAFESDGDPSDEDTVEANFKRTTRLRREAKCPKCSSIEDAITAESLPRLHVCYIAPDGKSRQCFNLETLRQIALKSSQLNLRVDIDGERQNFLQPPAFLTAMSDDLVDQIASKFGRGALDLHGAYYKNRETKYDIKDDGYAYDSNSSGDENIYDSFTAFRERVKDYFRNGMGSQDIYVCPLCYGQIHRTIANPTVDDDEDDDDDANKEYNAAPSDSIYDPIMVLGHLDNDDMSIASQFCFKKLADVKKHLREEHNVDTRGIEGNELYKRFRVRAPDGLLQRWLSTQVRGQVRQGNMRIYWGQGNDQIFVQLLDLIDRVKAYSEGLLHLGDNSSEENGADDEMDENVNKAREFFDTFATKASQLWNNIASPFLKSNENINDFIAKDDDSIEENDPDEKPHAILHQQYMNFMNEDSDENDLVHKLKRKYAETNDEQSVGKGSSTEEELEFVDDHKESDDEDKGNDQNIYNRNGYYSPIEEEEDEWVLKLQSQRKRNASSLKKQERTNTKIKTPIGKRLYRRKTTPTVTSSATLSTSKKKRTLTIEDSSDDESF